MMDCPGRCYVVGLTTVRRGIGDILEELAPVNELTKFAFETQKLSRFRELEVARLCLYTRVRKFYRLGLDKHGLGRNT
jgi:hypothetical protein